jgi:hypothetical protein
MEMFREKGVRLIAINDGIDTENGEDDFTPFRAILAEWYECVNSGTTNFLNYFHPRFAAH